ncbi:hypothetical protein BO82DRAFT_322800 [Aspergillus uvarum CBS 121591]|uniref:Protein kinase domain-containing protein n=1 Tax=Aspergillus uvarum CBS 121591 TaxID=1448315 RepID=A0A319CBQ2_9EURO|nr:hypothetical protein BO82DRAFT_322800 [Aspergillus uvarum CBS 121591]PYH76003.1 hypothetical protein BO82DRAFT_322800 [Aspergillus uvarum CBS 121591]
MIMDPVLARSHHLNWLPGCKVHFRGTNTCWRIDEILTEKIRTHDESRGTIEELTGVCRATQINGSDNWEEAIVKVKQQLSPWDDGSNDISSEAYREIENLQKLTENHCTSTPTLIDAIAFDQDTTMCFPGGYLVFILMEKVPGQDLGHFNSLTSEQRDDARLAFIKALWEFRSHGFYHHDPRRQNIIWDRYLKKCYIVDLEDAEEFGLSFSGLDPLVEFSLWNLHGKEEKSPDNHFDDDLMIPHERKDGWMFTYLEDLTNFLASRIRC